MEVIELDSSGEEHDISKRLKSEEGPPRYLRPPTRPIRKVRLAQLRAEDVIPVTEDRVTAPLAPDTDTAAPASEEPKNNLLIEWKKIEDQLRCDICKQLLDVPVALKCYHVFCSFCIRRYLELSGNDYCPSCRIPATSTDIRLEPRLAGILSILGHERGKVRKRIRNRLRGSESGTLSVSSKNETFNKQADLVDLFRSGQPVGRTLLPLYKNLKDKALRDLILEDGLDCLLENPQLSRDELIRHHKEFVFTLQAAHDAVRMGMYPGENGPTKTGLAKAFNMEYRLKCGTRRGALLGAQEMEVSKRRAEADKTESIADLTNEASRRMMDQLRNALRNRKGKTEET
jgi:hypothetical protein